MKTWGFALFVDLVIYNNKNWFSILVYMQSKLCLKKAWNVIHL